MWQLRQIILLHQFPDIDEDAGLGELPPADRLPDQAAEREREARRALSGGCKVLRSVFCMFLEAKLVTTPVNIVLRPDVGIEIMGSALCRGRTEGDLADLVDILLVAVLWPSWRCGLDDQSWLSQRQSTLA